ncbi:MAG: serine protease, partial [Spirochaetia bacterium]
MKRTLFLSLLILLIAGTVFAQLRNYVPIVRPVYDNAVRDFFNTLRRTMDGIGYKEIGTMLGAYVKGGYGSGFVYVARDGANYVVTNYHVVAGADAVNLEFERQDGTIVVYQNCPVIAANKAEDLALVSFRHDKRPFRSGLSFSNKTVRDGMEVWTAGYPALLDKPMWQLGKGNVTNSVARVPELVDPKLTPLIQHSAQVDAGNSGGPLLVADRSSTGGFKVIGVNSWKVVGRQAANFSVPAVRVKKFINASLAVRPKEDSAGTTAALERTCRGFSAAFTAGAKPYREIMVFISRDFVLKKGEHILPRVLASAPHSIRDEILSAFYNASPIEAVRMALAYYLYMAVTEK